MTTDLASGDRATGRTDADTLESRFLADPADTVGLTDELRSFLAFWWARHRPDGLPRRCDFDPIDLKPHLGRIMIVEVDRSDPSRLRFRYRLFGSRIAELQRTDLTGRYVDEAYSPARYAGTREIYRTMMADGCAHFMIGRAPLDKDFIVFERVLCPLRGNSGDDVDFLIGLFCYRS